MLDEANLLKGQELQPYCQYAYKLFLAECDRQNLHFRVTEVFRSQERQDKLYSQGRDMPGVIVTWTRNSLHSLRAAFDIQVINCTYEQVDSVAHLFNFGRNPALVKLGDLGHFEMTGCLQEPFKVSPSVVIRRFQRLIHWAGPVQKLRLQERLNQFLEKP